MARPFAAVCSWAGSASCALVLCTAQCQCWLDGPRRPQSRLDCHFDGLPHASWEPVANKRNNTKMEKWNHQSSLNDILWSICYALLTPVFGFFFPSGGCCYCSCATYRLTRSSSNASASAIVRWVGNVRLFNCWRVPCKFGIPQLTVSSVSYVFCAPMWLLLHLQFCLQTGSSEASGNHHHYHHPFSALPSSNNYQEND